MGAVSVMCKLSQPKEWHDTCQPVVHTSTDSELLYQQLCTRWTSRVYVLPVGWLADVAVSMVALLATGFPMCTWSRL